MADVICTQREAHQIHHREAAEDRCLHPDTIRLYQPCMGYKPCACTQTPSLHAGKGRFVSLHHPFLAPPPPAAPCACEQNNFTFFSFTHLIRPAGIRVSPPPARARMRRAGVRAPGRTHAGTRRGRPAPRA